MKVSVFAIANLSLCASILEPVSGKETRLRRLKRDPALNDMRNMLLQVRDIDGTAIVDGPDGATARFEGEESMSLKSAQEPVVTNAVTTVSPAEDAAAAILDSIIAPDEYASTESEPKKSHHNAKSGKHNGLSMGESDVKPDKHHGKHHDKESKADKEGAAGTQMAKAGKDAADKKGKAVKDAASISMEYGSKATKEALSMDSKAEKPALSMDSKASKSDSKAEKETLSMPAAKTMKEEAEEFWAEYEAKTGKGPSSVESKADKTISLSMDTKAAKGERMVDMSMPAGKTTKESATDMSLSKADKNMSIESKTEKIALSMDSKAAKSNPVTMEITEEYVSDLPHDAKAGKALSMDAHRLFPKSGKAGHSLSM